MKKFPALFALGLVCVLAVLPVSAETFRFKFANGDTYRINSVVNESVFVNRVLSHTADITNRITVEVSDVQPATGNAGFATAQHDCTFMSSERNSNRSFSWGREYTSIFRRDELGTYDIGVQYFMPVVRNVPVFPERDIKPGETWTGTGEEAYDLSDTFGIKEPFKVPFTVTYTYVGPVVIEGKSLHHIKAEYTLLFDSPRPAGAMQNDYPVTTMGFSKQNLYFDNENGILPLYNEEFRIQLQLASGIVMEFRGKAEATVTEIKLLDRAKIVQELNNEISRLGIKDTKASETDDGIMLSLENIQFEADSARLLPSEKEKITRLAALLERYPDKELLITGHTALAGTAGARQKLSEERADSVARLLVEMGVRSEYNIYTQGFGSDKPVAPNDTEANRARNRRVEITILDK